MSVRDAINLAPGTDPVAVRGGTADVFYVDDHGLIVPVASVDAGAVVLAASDHAQLRVVPRIDAVIAATPSAADDVAGVQAFVDALAARIGPDMAVPLEQCNAADVPGVLAELLPRYVEQQKTQHARVAAEGIQADVDRLALAYRRAEQDIKHPGAALGRTSRDPLVAVLGLIGDAQGFTAREPAANSVTNNVRADARLAGIAHASGVRYRSVRLTGDWRKSAAVPYLGFVSGREGDMTPVALIPNGTRYRMHFADGHSVPLGDDQHERLQVWAFEFYTPLPRDRAVTPRDVARLAMRHTRRDWSVIVVMAAAVVGLGLLTPILTQVLLNDFVPHGDTSMIMQAGLALVAAAFVIGAFSMVQYFAMSRLAQRATARVQPALWDRVLSMPTAFFRNFSSGDLSVRVMAADALQQLVNVQVVGAVLAALFSMVNLVLMFHYNVMLGVAGLVVLLITLAVMGWALLAMQGLYTQSIDAQLVGTSWVVQLLTGIGKVRLANAEVRMQSTYLDLVRRQVVALSRMTNVIGRAQAWVVFATSGATALFFALIGVQWGSNGTMVDSSTFVAFNTAFVAAFGAVTGVTASLVTLASAAPIFKLLEPIMQGLPEAASHKADPGALRGDLEFRNVTFRYGSDSPVVLDRMNFKIEAGQMVAIVGASGSGKSTMIRQMLGFDEPTDGQVLLDGRNLRDLDLDLVRAQMGVVIQDGKITRTSILKNILGGAGNDERLAWEAAEKAALADDIRAMPMKMQTVVDPQLLSGGQAQRIMLARALVRRPNVVVLDEATSALDNLAQASVTEALTQLGATRVVVAHRLSTIRSADRILVIEKGRVIEDGDYDTLMAKPAGAFRALAQRQLA
jgi:ATP-binding cassette subfamily C protein